MNKDELSWKKFEIKNSIDGRPVVNIENKTTVTTIMDQKIYDVKKIEQGMEDIFSRINAL